MGYCAFDVAREAYKLKKNNYIDERTKEQMSMAQCITERTIFQFTASIAVPYVVVHSTVNISHRILDKINKFKRWGPSLLGLAVIPLLPKYLDEPVEHLVESGFKKYGPWRPGGIWAYKDGKRD